MKELIKPVRPLGFRQMSEVFGNGKNTNSRNSRDVHKYLGVKTAYHKWIVRRIDGQGVEENIDFTVVKNGQGENGQFESIDYIVTDDFAKHLGMIEKTPKGKEVRNYFIYMERLARYLLEKHIQECDVRSEKKEIKFIEKIEHQAKIIKQNKQYAKVRGFGFETAHRIIAIKEADISTSDFNKLLLREGLIRGEERVVIDYLPTGEASLGDLGAVVIHVDSAAMVLDKYNIPQKVDAQQRFDF